MEAALLASREIGFTIISMTISLVAVFIPVLFMGGIVGRLLHEFSVTITVAILISGFVSLSLTPMLGSRFLRYRPRRPPRTAVSRVRRRFNGHGARLRRTRCKACCAIHSRRFCSRLLLLGGTVYLFFTMPTGFIPSQDSGFLFRRHAGQPGYFVRLHGQAPARAYADIVQHDPNVADTGAFADGTATRAASSPMMKPRSERKLSRGPDHRRSCGPSCPASRA